MQGILLFSSIDQNAWMVFAAGGLFLVKGSGGSRSGCKRCCCFNDREQIRRESRGCRRPPTFDRSPFDRRFRLSCIGDVRPVALTEIDRNLLNRCLAQEPEAWKDFVDRFMGLFIHVIQHSAHARSVRITSHDIDDLCAEIFVTLLANDFATLKNFRGNSSLATYLTVIARRIVVREIAQRRMAEALGHVNAHQSSLEQAHVQPSEERRVDSREEINQLLVHLPSNDAEVVKQFHIEGKTYREISNGLGIPENTIGPLLSRARAKLRRSQMQSQ